MRELSCEGGRCGTVLVIAKTDAWLDDHDTTFLDPKDDFDASMTSMELELPYLAEQSCPKHISMI